MWGSGRVQPPFKHRLAGVKKRPLHSAVLEPGDGQWGQEPACHYARTRTRLPDPHPNSGVRAVSDPDGPIRYQPPTTPSPKPHPSSGPGHGRDAEGNLGDGIIGDPRAGRGLARWVPRVSGLKCCSRVEWPKYIHSGVISPQKVSLVPQACVPAAIPPTATPHRTPAGATRRRRREGGEG